MNSIEVVGVARVVGNVIHMMEAMNNMITKKTIDLAQLLKPVEAHKVEKNYQALMSLEENGCHLSIDVFCCCCLGVE